MPAAIEGFLSIERVLLLEGALLLSPKAGQLQYWALITFLILGCALLSEYGEHNSGYVVQELLNDMTLGDGAVMKEYWDRSPAFQEGMCCNGLRRTTVTAAFEMIYEEYDKKLRHLCGCEGCREA